MTLINSSGRLDYLDTLKVFLVSLVIVHHAGLAYTPSGAFWYYTSPVTINWLQGFLLINSSFFMGLFFFISGYFLPGSFDRHKVGPYVSEKLFRLGIPLLLGIFVIIPYEMYFWHLYQGDTTGFIPYYIHDYLGIGNRAATIKGPFTPELNLGHLWYIEHLLVYSLLYAVIRSVAKTKNPENSPSFPATWKILLFTLLLGIVTEVVRTSLGFTVNKWSNFLGFISVEVAHVPQYLSFFVLGIVAYRNRWFEMLPPKICAAFFFAGMFMAVYAWIGSNYFGAKVLEYWAIKEAVIAVGFSLGLLALFKGVFERTGPFLKKASSAAYGAYIVNVPCVITLQALFHPIEAPVLVQFLAVCLLAIGSSFGLGYLLHCIPQLKRVF